MFCMREDRRGTICCPNVVVSMLTLLKLLTDEANPERCVMAMSAICTQLALFR